jgi:DAACS family dicarboxylate/amino acid:cation (Na+ or H+) symporter
MMLGVALGIGAGVIAHLTAGGSPALEAVVAYGARPVGQVYIRLLFMLVIPMLFCALSLGVAGLGDVRHLGRVGARTLLYTIGVSTIAVFIGLFLVNVLQPGAGIPPETRERLMAGSAARASTFTAPKGAASATDLLVSIIPSNPIKAAAEGDMLAVMFFSLLIGIGIALLPEGTTAPLRQVLESLYEVIMRLIRMVIAAAPVGVAALLFTLTSELGYEILGQLALYVGVVVLGLAIHQFGVYSLAVKYLGGMSPLRFFKGIQPAMIMAFSTASSNATLPTALEVAEDELKLPRHVSRFVLTIGATANQNGTALFEGVTVLFLAQFYGVELALGQQALVVLVCILGGIGTAGVPAGSIPILIMILGMVGVPAEGIGLILGVDRFLDMCRTTLNVSGDLAAAVVVSRGEPAAIQPG